MRGRAFKRRYPSRYTCPRGHLVVLSYEYLRGIIGFITRSAFPFPNRSERCKAVRAPLLPARASSSESRRHRRRIRHRRERDRIDPSRRYGITTRLIICMSRPMPRLTKSYGREPVEAFRRKNTGDWRRLRSGMENAAQRCLEIR